MIDDVCSDVPNAFWHRKKHIVDLPYIKDFNEKKLIRNSKSPWSCSAFYVQKNTEIERGTPRLVINYKPLNKVLEWIRYPIPNTNDLVHRLSEAIVFSKFDMKSGFWLIQISENDRYKIVFTTPFGHYEWNVMPFGLKNAPSEFQNMWNDIFNSLYIYIYIYIYKEERNKKRSTW